MVNDLVNGGMVNDDLVSAAITDPHDLLGRAIGWRAGLGVAATPLPVMAADPPIEQWSATSEPVRMLSTSGGAGRTAEAARGAAIGELVERYTASVAPLDERPEPPAGADRIGVEGFSLGETPLPTSPRAHREHWLADRWAEVFRLRDNQPVWVPAGLVGLRPDLGGVATSSGLAAASTVARALLRASQEVLERDALMVCWLHGLAPTPRPVTDGVRSLAEAVSARVEVFDATQAWNPHRVAVVTGSARVEGRWRHAFGLACRGAWHEAVEKASLEWAQGIVYTGITTADDPVGLDDAARAARWPPETCNDFDEHARFYTRRPDLWGRLPWFGGNVHTVRETQPASHDDAGGDTDLDQLRHLVQRLSAAGVELLYRELTGPEAAGCGLRVVRVLSPQLAPINGDHRRRFTGGTVADWRWRYPKGRPGVRFPSAFPHPLG